MMAKHLEMTKISHRSLKYKDEKLLEHCEFEIQ